jgi:hypothetical protein
VSRVERLPERLVVRRGLDAAVETGDRPVDQPPLPLGGRVRILMRPIQEHAPEAECGRGAVFSRRSDAVSGERGRARARPHGLCRRRRDELQRADDEESGGDERHEHEEDFLRQEPFHGHI